MSRLLTARINTTLAGLTVQVAEGVSGYVTGFHQEGKHVMGAFIKVPMLDGAGPMIYARLGRTADDGKREVVSIRPIDRDEFDQITELDALRRDLGWR